MRTYEDVMTCPVCGVENDLTDDGYWVCRSACTVCSRCDGRGVTNHEDPCSRCGGERLAAGTPSEHQRDVQPEIFDYGEIEPGLVDHTERTPAGCRAESERAADLRALGWTIMPPRLTGDRLANADLANLFAELYEHAEEASFNYHDAGDGLGMVMFCKGLAEAYGFAHRQAATGGHPAPDFTRIIERQLKGAADWMTGDADEEEQEPEDCPHCGAAEALEAAGGLCESCDAEAER